MELPPNPTVISNPPSRVMYCDSVFLDGDCGKDAAKATKYIVDEWLGSCKPRRIPVAVARDGALSLLRA